MFRIPEPAAWKRLAAEAADFCLPRRCVLCQRALEDGDPFLCPRCAEHLPRTHGQAAQAGMHFSRCLSPLWYDEAVRESFLRYKFNAHWHYSHAYGQWMWDCLRRQEPDWQRFDLVTWTPLSLPRYLRRGYDQSKRLAQVVAAHSGLPLVSTLVKHRHIAAQSGTASAQERWENVQGVYRLRSGSVSPGQQHPNTSSSLRDLHGLRILLVDDIITTGATLEEASRVLQSGGAAEVCCLTLARSIADHS